MKNHVVCRSIGRCLGASLLAVCVQTSALAAESSDGIEVGDYILTGVFDFGLEYDDNIYREESSETSSSILLIEPDLRLVNENADRSIELTYTGEYAGYENDSDDNYDSHFLGIDTSFRVGESSRFGGAISYEIDNEPRGTGSTEGLNSTLVDGPTESDRITVEGFFNVGEDSGNSEFQFTAGRSDVEFNDFREITAGRDRDETYVSAEYRRRLSAPTSFFVELAYTEFDYDSTLPGFTDEIDNDQSEASLGLQWSMTRLTSGKVAIGYLRKELDDINSDFSGFAWSVEINWRPTSLDNVQFSTSRTPNETFGSGVFQVVDNYQATWNRQLSRAWEVELAANFSDIELEDENRDEDYTDFSIGLIYLINRKSQIAFSFIDETKDSNVNTFDYDRRVVSVTYSINL